jgi:hypothetical protein
VELPLPTGPCRHCGCRDYWRREQGQWLCAICHPVPCPEVVAQDCRFTDPPPPLTGLSPKVREALEHSGWEPAEAVEFPEDVAATVAFAETSADPQNAERGASAPRGAPNVA